MPDNRLTAYSISSSGRVASIQSSDSYRQNQGLCAKTRSSSSIDLYEFMQKGKMPKLSLKDRDVI